MVGSNDRGQVMARELSEQPDRVAALPTSLGQVAEDVAAWARPRARRVIYVGRGTSANAALYGRYLAGILAGMPTSLAIPGLSTLYGAQLQFDGSLVVAISQSGETDDVVAYLERARADGALTVAVTNEPTSPLAVAAHRVLPTHAGPERAIPATKTYTTQLAVLLLFWASWAGRDDLVESVAGPVPDGMRQALVTAADVGSVARQHVHATWMVTAARGINHGNAREAALKILEASYVPALAFSVADLWHGPIASAQEAPLTILLDYTGPASDSTAELARHLAEAGRPLLVIAPPGQTLEAATYPVAIAAELPELVSPLITILPAQEFARSLGVARGVDPDQPRGLSKVTHTR